MIGVKSTNFLQIPNKWIIIDILRSSCGQEVLREKNWELVYIETIVLNLIPVIYIKS